MSAGGSSEARPLSRPAVRLPVRRFERPRECADVLALTLNPVTEACLTIASETRIIAPLVWGANFSRIRTLLPAHLILFSTFYFCPRSGCPAAPAGPSALICRVKQRSKAEHTA